MHRVGVGSAWEFYIMMFLYCFMDYFINSVMNSFINCNRNTFMDLFIWNV